MKRRDFLKVLLSSSLYLAARPLLAYTAAPPGDVGIARGKDSDQAVRKAIELIGGIRRFVSPGAVVLVKPNISFNSPPELKANTDPRIVRTLVHLCFEALAAKVYVCDRSLTSPKLSYRTSGIEAAAREAGARMLYVNEVSDKLYPLVRVPDGVFLKETRVNRFVLEADVLINVPVAKHHSAAGLSLGMKNLMGLTGDNRSRWHWQLHEAISDFNRVVTSDLTVIDATAIMLRNGPTGGRLEYLKPLDTVIASGRVVQADSEACRLFDLKPEDLGYLRLAEAKGLGRLSGYARAQAEI
jgi:uncharacterized protein (DUF362 family)